jgi:hypothetical protein
MDADLDPSSFHADLDPSSCGFGSVFMRIWIRLHADLDPSSCGFGIRLISFGFNGLAHWRTNPYRVYS